MNGFGNSNHEHITTLNNAPTASATFHHRPRIIDIVNNPSPVHASPRRI
jgi:hypothetical protein